MRKYRFVVGVSLAALEEEVNRQVAQAPDLRLLQVLYAAGSGFVGVMEEGATAGEQRQEPEPPPARPAAQATKSSSKARGTRKG